MAKYSNSEEDIKRRCSQYECDGVCYSHDKMCNRVDTCPETRCKEFAATVAAVILIASFYLLALVLLLAVFVGGK